MLAPVLVQIVPGLPPLTDGVGDYSLAVANILRGEFGVDSHFLVGRRGWRRGQRRSTASVWNPWALQSAPNLARLLEELQSDSGTSAALLQLSAYGYARRG